MRRPPRTVPALGLLQRRLSRAAAALLVLSGLGTVLFLVTDSLLLRTAAFVLVAIGCMLAVGSGTLLNLESGRRRAWWWVFWAAGLFLCGALGRPMAGTTGWVSFLPDVLTMAGYFALSAALLRWLDTGRRSSTGSDVLDASLVGVGASLAAWAFLVVPTLRDPDVDATRRMLLAMYPVLDAVLLTLAARVTFSRGARYGSFWFFLLGLAAIFTGDLGYAVAAARNEAASLVADAPYLLAYGAIGASALHPSMRRLSAPAAVRYDGWSRTRLIAISIALLCPALLMAASPAVNLLDRIVRALLAAVLTGLVLRRTVQAINDYAASEQVARHRASHDALTGLPNRQRLRDYLEQELPAAASAGEPVSVLFMDLDGFKLVNDSYGHGVGDELLVAAGARIREHVRDEDFVARIGGDEFVIVARHGEVARAEGLAERLIDAFHQPLELSSGPMFISPSIGISRRSPRDGSSDHESLIREADTAMYKAKAGGRNRWAVFDTSLREAVRTRIETENGLRRALDEGELELHYQPVVDMGTGRVSGYEALLRWRHPTRGLVSPDEFIPIAEESWLIVPMGAWVLRQAVADLAGWRRDGQVDAHVAVNVSARQLRDGSLVDLVSRALAESGLPGSALCLELTESALVLDPSAAQQTLKALRELGVAIAVDDFGTGYSALGYLKRFPVSQVKIDRSFVQELGTEDDDALVRAIISMGHALGLTVVAEGVETRAQERALLSLGCRIGQGYRYGRPVPTPAAAEQPPAPALTA